MPTQQKTTPFPKKVIAPGWEKGREARNQQGWRDRCVDSGPQGRPILAKFQVLFQENAGAEEKKKKL